MNINLLTVEQSLHINELLEKNFPPEVISTFTNVSIESIQEIAQHKIQLINVQSNPSQSKRAYRKIAKKPFTKAEIFLLKKLYPTVDSNTLSKVFRKEQRSIQQKASTLKIKKESMKLNTPLSLLVKEALPDIKIMSDEDAIKTITKKVREFETKLISSREESQDQSELVLECTNLDEFQQEELDYFDSYSPMHKNDSQQSMLFLESYEPLHSTEFHLEKESKVDNILYIEPYESINITNHNQQDNPTMENILYID